MSVDSSTQRLLIFSIVFTICMPVFVYAFTFNTGTPSDQIGIISAAALMAAGIDVSDAVTHNITAGVIARTEFDLDDFDYGVTWFGTPSNLFTFERKDTYIPIFWHLMYTPPAYSGNSYSEANVIANWSDTYNWTRITIQGKSKGADAEVFFQIPVSSNGSFCYSNITTTLAAQSNVTVTIGRGWTENKASLLRFVNWYWRQITGLETYGMPTFLVWLMRIFSIITLVVIVMFVRSMLTL